MFLLAVLAVLVLFAYWMLSTYRGWRRNIAACKQSGLYYFVTPFQVDSMFWMTVQFMVIPILKRLPKSWTAPWEQFLGSTWAWHSRTEPFEKYGGTFVGASPLGTYLTTSDPAVITQITTRRTDFQKPVDVYIIVEIYGRNVLTTEGAMWRTHRRLTAPSFNERSNALVWSESLHQTEGMLRYWAQLDKGNSMDDMRVKDVALGAGWLSLHVISRAGFGVRLYWPHEEGGGVGEGAVAGIGSPTPPRGHTMTFKDALNMTLHGALWIGIFGTKVLNWSPFRKQKTDVAAYENLKKYFEELIALKKADLLAGDSDKETMDLLVPLLTPNKSDPTDQTLSDAEIIGNLFIFLFAGHETTANTIHSALIFLSCCRGSQRRLQADIDRLFGSKSPETWDYASNINHVYGSMVGACINEVLRLMPSVILIPKRVGPTPQTIIVDGVEKVIPAKTFIHVNVVAAARQPKHWPHSPSKRTGKSHDLDDFVPERWLVNPTDQREVDGEMDGTNIEAPGLFAPKPGVFVPFSLGPRACMGRRFAVVEVIAILAAMFQGYSVELDVSEWASDEEVERMGEEQRKEVYQKAVDRAWWMVEKDCESLITLKMNGRVPVRLARRGKERFGDF